MPRSIAHPSAPLVSEAPRGRRPFARPPLRRVFAIRDYRILWSGALAMIIAQQLRFIAIPQWLVDETGEFTQVAIVGAIQLPVQIVAVLYGGVLADRLDSALADGRLQRDGVPAVAAARGHGDGGCAEGLARLDRAGRLGRAGGVRGAVARGDHAAGCAAALPLGRRDGRRRDAERRLGFWARRYSR